MTHKAFTITAVRARPMAGAVLTAALAAGSIMLTIAAGAVRLVSVSAESRTVLIEASDPVAYTVSRPDPLTVFVDLRDVTIGETAPRIGPDAAVSSVRLERATAPDGLAVARVRLALARPAEFTVKSTRSVIRVDFAASAAARPARAVDAKTASDSRTAGSPARAAGATAATAIQVVRAVRDGASTFVTISADGTLPPHRVGEIRDELPRRLVLDFPNVTTRAAAQTPGDGDLVRRVRVALNSRSPLMTRVVMEVAPGVTYAVRRNTPTERDLTVVFTAPATAGTSMTAPDSGAAGLLGFDTIPLEQAIANGAPLEPPADSGPAALDPIAVLTKVQHTTVRASRTPPAWGAALQASAAQAVPQGDPAPAAPQPPGPPPAPAPAAPPATSPVIQGPGLQGPQGQQISTSQEKKYIGHPISMDFQGADLRSVLRTFAEISGLNMVIDPDVQGTVDIVLTDVPWDQALDVILRGNGLDYTVDGTIVRIARIETLRREQEARTQLAQSAANAGALVVRTYTLSYARADQAAPLIRSSVLSQRGNVQIDARTNTLIITDLPARLDTVSQLLSTIDRAEPQVEIEARIITTTREYARALGVQWGFNGRANADIGNTTNLTFPNSGSLGGRAGGIQGPGASDVRAGELEAAGTAINLGVPTATSAVGLALGSINGAFNLDVALSALERTGKGRILSTPRVTTQNNVEAEITQGVQIPVQTEANNTVTVTFKDAALTLKVTPQITAANTVIMQITLENATPGVPVNNIPSIDTQRAITRVQVSDGMTTVMGGIFVSREQTTNDRTPMLHRIPFLSWLFKRDSQVDESRELLIFITPRIQKG